MPVSGCDGYYRLDMLVKDERQSQMDILQPDFVQSRKIIESLCGMLTVLNSTRDLDDILACIVEQPHALLGCEASAIYRLDTQSGKLSIQAAQGMAPALTTMPVALGRGPAGKAAMMRQPITVTDCAVLLQNEALRKQPEKLALLRHLATTYQAVIAVPLLIKDDVYGALTVCYHEPRDFTQEEVALVTAFGVQAALAIENANLRTQAHEMATMAERGRLARDLHDSVTQSLYAMTLYSEATSRLLDSGNVEGTSTRLVEIQKMAQAALQEMRVFLFNLRIPELEREGLIEALRNRLESVENRSGIKTNLHVNGEIRLDLQQSELLYWIVQEALNNVLKHAQARGVWVTIEQLGDQLKVTVQDDGLGFDPKPTSYGMGLRNMAERAAQLGGTLLIASLFNSGTTVQIEVAL